MAIPMILIFIFAACTPVDNNDDNEQAANESIIKSLEEEILDLEARNQELEEALVGLDKDDDDDKEDVDLDQEDVFLIMALEVMEDIKNKDFDDLSDYLGEEGLLFSPYGYVDMENAVTLSKSEVDNLDDNNEEYEWGSYDGTGDPIVLNFQDYYEEFIYNQDFLNPEIIGNNVRIGQGNTLENIHETFDNAQYVEFHFSGFDDQYEGMDWESLRLVFTQDGDSWNLLAIVHDQWTI